MTTTKVELTDVWEYDVDKALRLRGWAAESIELTYLGIPYSMSNEVDGKPTIRKTAS